ncbi:hypothetical protein CEQ90_08510 [Lewinellaceae bacterium SD302]|nr:hypothetical protein CEQ90_08510 [Lewinellaceae bacterium SD302]
MNRRNFLRKAGLLGIPLAAAPLNVSFTRALSTLVDPDDDKVLVLIQLSGGNDGLNTLIPLDQYVNLNANRAALMLPENSLINLTDNQAFHPNMTGMADLFNDGKLGAIQGVGYPNQNRSHFRSTDIWTSASDAEEVVTTGWLGRNFASDHPTYPENFPNEDYPDPFAIAMGSQVSQTCQGTGVNFSMALNDPFNVTSLAVGGDTPLPDTPYGEELGFLRTSIGQANAYGAVVQERAEAGNSLVDYPDNGFANALKNVAYLVSGGLQSKVYVVNLGGFDTHASQVVAGNPQAGEHAELLQTLSDGMAAFHADLAALGLEERVISMTFSEFGRRIAANDSLGTDHGSAAPLFLMGSCVAPGFLGSSPEIPEVADVNEGVAMQYDFRDIYGSVLQDWFNLDPADVSAVLGHDFVHLPVLSLCDVVNSTETDTQTEELTASVYPNPFASRINVSLVSDGSQAELSIFDVTGKRIELVFSKRLAAGRHRFFVDLENQPAGAYFVRLQMGTRTLSKRIVKSK